MLFVDDNAAGSIERAASPCINEKQHAFSGVEFCQLSVVLFNQRFGSIIGKKAEILGGLVLIGIGVQILWTHFHG